MNLGVGGGVGVGVGGGEMVISIDYLCAYDPAVCPCILKSTQITGFNNSVLREK